MVKIKEVVLSFILVPFEINVQIVELVFLKMQHDLLSVQFLGTYVVLESQIYSGSSRVNVESCNMLIG